MSDLDKLKDAAGKALGDSNDYVQAKAPGLIEKYGKYFIYFCGAVLVIVCLHFMVTK